MGAQARHVSKSLVTMIGSRKSTLESLYDDVLSQLPELQVLTDYTIVKLVDNYYLQFFVKYDVKGNWESDIYRKINKLIVKRNVYVRLKVRMDDRTNVENE